jgi:hypothetical protein
MAVKANVKVFQEAMSNTLPPSAVQAATLSDMLLSIYRGLCWHVSKFSYGPIDYSQTLHKTFCSFSGHSVFMKKTVFIFPTICACATTRRFTRKTDVTFMCCVN